MLAGWEETESVCGKRIWHHATAWVVTFFGTVNRWTFIPQRTDIYLLFVDVWITCFGCCHSDPHPLLWLKCSKTAMGIRCSWHEHSLRMFFFTGLIEHRWTEDFQLLTTLRGTVSTEYFKFSNKISKIQYPRFPTCALTHCTKGLFTTSYTYWCTSMNVMHRSLSLH